MRVWMRRVSGTHSHIRVRTLSLCHFASGAQSTDHIGFHDKVFSPLLSKVCKDGKRGEKVGGCGGGDHGVVNVRIGVEVCVWACEEDATALKEVLVNVFGTWRSRRSRRSRKDQAGGTGKDRERTARGAEENEARVDDDTEERHTHTPHARTHTPNQPRSSRSCFKVPMVAMGKTSYSSSRQVTVFWSVSRMCMCSASSRACNSVSRVKVMFQSGLRPSMVSKSSHT